MHLLSAFIRQPAANSTYSERVRSPTASELSACRFDHTHLSYILPFISISYLPAFAVPILINSTLWSLFCLLVKQIPGINLFANLFFNPNCSCIMLKHVKESLEESRHLGRFNNQQDCSFKPGNFTRINNHFGFYSRFQKEGVKGIRVVKGTFFWLYTTNNFIIKPNNGMQLYFQSNF